MRSLGLVLLGAALAAASDLPSLYLVRFHDAVAADAPAEVKGVYQRLEEGHAEGQWHAVQQHGFKHVLTGAAVWLSPEAAAWLQAHPAVADVEKDQEVHLPEPVGGSSPQVEAWETNGKPRGVHTGSHRDAHLRRLQVAGERTQTNIEAFNLWNLDRSDQTDAPPYSGTYSYVTDGAGVDVYVVDSGVLQSHVDFQGRALPGFDGINDGRPAASDCNGHGTHVAGTVGGATVGIAKNSTLISVRVFGCTGGGSTVVILNALEWVSQAAAAARAATGRRGVVNMSLGGGRSTVLDAATNSLARQDVVVVVAAGNENQDACNTSPGAAELAISVGATDIADVKATFSNFGPCVDVQAPGVDIFSAGHTGDTVGTVLSGTSMAAPAVAGMAARYLQQRPTATATEVREALLCASVRNTVTGLPADGTPNLLLHSTPAGLGVPAADGSCGPVPGTSPPPPLPCPNDCSQRGVCQADGTCACQCGWMGPDCRTALAVREGGGLSGAVTWGTDVPEATAVFGQEGPEVFVALTVPEGVTALTLSTCGPATNFDTFMWLLSACPSPGLTGDDVVGVVDDGPPGVCTAVPAPLPPYTPTNFPPHSRLVVQAPLPGRYHVMVEGYQAAAGAFTLTWDMEAPPGVVGASPSPTPAPHTTTSPLPRVTTGVPTPTDNGFGNGQPVSESVPAAGGIATLSWAAAITVVLASVCRWMW